MPEVQNVGAVDYAQYQPSQYPQESYAEEYNTQPEVYDENFAQMQAANKSRLGATLFSTAAAVGVGLVGGYFIGKRGKGDTSSIKKELDAVKKELTDLKNSEAVKNYDKLKEAANEIANIAEGKKVFFKGWITGAKSFIEKIKTLLKPFKDDAKKAAENTKEKVEDVKDDVKKAAEETKDAAQELKEHSTDSNK